MYPVLEIDISWRDLFAAILWPATSLRLPRLEQHAPTGGILMPALSVRSAFDALLTALALPRGSKVVVSAINIEAMDAIARKHGLELHPIDLELSDLLPRPDALAAALRSGARLFVLAHLYGTRGNVTELAAICREHDVLFIEDCAQAFSGQLLKSSADVSLYSFGPIKPSTALGGAIAIFNDSSLALSVSQILAAHPRLSEWWFRRRLAKYALLKATLYPRPYGLLFRCIRAAGMDPEQLVRSMTRSFQGDDLFRHIRRSPPLRLLGLLDRRLTQTGEGKIAQRKRAQTVGSAVSDVALSPGAKSMSHSWWLTPILSENPQVLMDLLRNDGFDAARGATSLCALKAPGIETPNADYLLRQVLYLPNAKRFSERDIRRLIERVRSTVRRNPSSGTELLAQRVSDRI
jgi:dTDP-4-amino-4,6-dideoxygalactose transaminase